MVSKTDIAGKVENRRAGLPSTITTAIIEEYVEDAHIVLENRTGESFATTDIPTKFQAVITDMALLNVISYLIKRRFAAGEVNISYSDLVSEKKMLEEKVESQLLDLVRGTGLITTTEPTVS